MQQNVVTLADISTGRLLVPSPPLLSSRTAPWNGILLEYHRLPPGGDSELCPRQPLLSIHLGRPARLELSKKRHLRRFCKTFGDIIILPPGVLWRIHRMDMTEPLFISLDPDFVIRATGDTTNTELIAVVGARDPVVESIAFALKADVETHYQTGRIYGDSLALALTVHLLRKYSSRQLILPQYGGGLPRYKLRRAIEYINANLDKNVSLADIADEVDLSPYHFARLFKQSTRLAPHQYLIRCRIDHAKLLLAQTDLPITEIAFRVGFQHQSHFTTQFHRETGLTPKDYRRSL